MKISILVPVYNVERYLKQCMDSIVNQSYKNLEIICMDDGSTDSSGEILDAYAKADERVKVIHKENTGYGHSMNLGIELATGDYIGIVESDDYISSDMFEKLADIVKCANEEIEVVKSNYYEVTEKSCKKIYRHTAASCNQIIKPTEYPKVFVEACNIWTSIYKRDYLNKHNIRFLETPGASYQDAGFYFKTLVMADKVCLTEEAFYHYRVDNMNASVKSNKKIFCVCDETDEMKRYCRERNLFGGDIEGFYYALMFQMYNWNFWRLHIALRSAFWIRFEEELQRMEQSEFFKEKYWTPIFWEKAKKIVEDREAFFWNSMQECLMFECDKLTIKDEWYVNSIESCIEKEECIYIYGAGVIANRVYKYIEKHDMTEKIAGFIVTDVNSNPKSLYGKQVYSVEHLGDNAKDALVIVAVAEASQIEILRTISAIGHTRVVRVDGMWHEKLKNN